MRSSAQNPFDAGCAQLEFVLSGSIRQAIADELSEAANLDAALQDLRATLRANVLRAGVAHIALERIVNTFDRETRQEGFHVLHDWDGRADSVAEDSIPIDVLNYVARVRGTDPADRRVIAIILDYYLLHLLALFALRIWDAGDPDANLDRMDRLLQDLQGPNGSGQLFVKDAETLILIATSHFELQERGYDRLLSRVRRLNRAHQTNIALGHASSMGSHLRFGFEATYARDTIMMRDDNVADYPWLCYALLTVMAEYLRLRDGGSVGAAGTRRDALVEALLNGLSGDARAFVGAPPAFMSRCEADRVAFRDRFLGYRDELLDEFERFRPSDKQYSPLSLFFNFSHNIVKGTVVDALLRGDPWRVTFNDLLTGLPSEALGTAPGEAKPLLATTLMTYARLNPDRIRGQLMPVIVYDPHAGRQAFGTTMRRLRA
jgi:hypothetical protein